ncbi:hypothetical protein RRG08_046021 [Elysia crispata]|uniref:Uncharacterized protein n=1 Tax=Elysia crispata TaxID=231223 RepID=A0AAE1DE99_9GAST|nr:hypothetical protein RRG08_046021 [Elysia crispata]
MDSIVQGFREVFPARKHRSTPVCEISSNFIALRNSGATNMSPEWNQRSLSYTVFQRHFAGYFELTFTVTETRQTVFTLVVCGCDL